MLRLGDWALDRAVSTTMNLNDLLLDKGFDPDTDGISLAGRGTLSGVVGPCPVCLDFSKDLFLIYENSSWDVDF